ncbi:pitrilysin family protein [Tateyamaria sp. Alg231-49]|uniref:M16 family metallopeptidase n=1 Tax=Tateyamaria sp. Alg231-49 TaxID=1922219 RepID=UPI000D559031|nr:pitrilysin family protein [Tateyamaria sp. Alg231-49]
MTRLFLIIAIAFAAALPARADVEIEEVVSPGGITAWLVREPSIPFMAIELRFRGGASLDAPDTRGAINLMTSLLEEGAADLDARAFARAQESLAVSFGYDVGDDALSVSGTFLSENRDEAVELLRQSIIEPSFASEALERVREQVLTGLRSDAKDPDEIARRTFDAMAFGDHPYATDYSGTIESVTALSRDDMLAAHSAAFARDRLYVGVAGDITPEELGPLLDTLLGELPEIGAPMPEPAPVLIEGGTTVVEFETPQSVAIFGQRGIAQDDPDYFAAAVLNQVLGAGGFESRLMDEVRKKRGLTYGVYSYLAPQDYAATLQGQVASANESIAEAVSVIRDEWARAAAEGITLKELDAAKTYITGAYPLRFDGNGPIARIMVGMQMLGLPIDYIATRNDKVDAVTLEDVSRVAGELLDPENLHFVVVGQPVGLESSVAN